MFIFRMRQGIGIDIEYSEDICHIVVDDEGKESVLAFNGGIIKLPFFQIYFGEFAYLDALSEEQG